jgi:hypothetical protein
MRADDLPLFRWTPPEPRPCQIIAFPLTNRVGKVRDVAAKLAAKSTDRHIASYRDQVTTALHSQLARLGVSEQKQGEQVAAFWNAVQAETNRITYQGRRPGGAA